jgi:hypothetical protein
MRCAVLGFTVAANANASSAAYLKKIKGDQMQHMTVQQAPTLLQFLNAGWHTLFLCACSGLNH